MVWSSKQDGAAKAPASYGIAFYDTPFVINRTQKIASVPVFFFPLCKAVERSNLIPLELTHGQLPVPGGWFCVFFDFCAEIPYINFGRELPCFRVSAIRAAARYRPTLLRMRTTGSLTSAPCTECFPATRQRRCAAFRAPQRSSASAACMSKTNLPGSVSKPSKASAEAMPCSAFSVGNWGWIPRPQRSRTSVRTRERQSRRLSRRPTAITAKGCPGRPASSAVPRMSSCRGAQCPPGPRQSARPAPQKSPSQTSAMTTASE